MSRQVVTVKDRQAIYDQYGYSPAVRVPAGELLFVSGQVGSDSEGNPIADAPAQIDRAFQNLAGVLAAAGCDFGDVVDVTSFHTDAFANMPAIMEAKAQYFGSAPNPNWTAVGVTSLADPAYVFEIKVIARIPGD